MGVQRIRAELECEKQCRALCGMLCSAGLSYCRHSLAPWYGVKALCRNLTAARCSCLRLHRISIIINGMELTASSVRLSLAPASGSDSCSALDVNPSTPVMFNAIE